MIRSPVLLMLAAALLGGVAVAQEDDRERDPQDRFAVLREKAAEIISGMQQLSDWDTHYTYMIDAVERVYERNGWTSEPDLFSLELMREVEQIPPWQVQERMDAAFEIIGDRYLLDERQTQKLRQLVIRENVKLFSKHADRVMDYALDAISTRAAGEPFTPEQIARWAQLAEPVFNDSRESFKRTAQEFMQVLDPEQRELVAADVAAAEQRLDAIAKMSTQWKQGKWRPEDWGMEDDPIQNRAVEGDARRPIDRVAQAQDGDGAAPPAAGGVDPRGSPRAGRREGESASGRPPVTGDPEAQPPRPDRNPDGKTGAAQPDDEWTRYVKAFIAKYKLNDEQQQRAWLYHKDAVKRGDATRARFKRLTADLLGAEDPRSAERLKKYTEQRDQDLQRLFERLKTRLEKLPTRAQRRAAAAAERPASKP